MHKSTPPPKVAPVRPGTRRGEARDYVPLPSSTSDDVGSPPAGQRTGIAVDTTKRRGPTDGIAIQTWRESLQAPVPVSLFGVEECPPGWNWLEPESVFAIPPATAPVDPRIEAT